MQLEVFWLQTLQRISKLIGNKSPGKWEAASRSPSRSNSYCIIAAACPTAPLFSLCRDEGAPICVLQLLICCLSAPCESQLKIRVTIFMGCISCVGCNPSSLSSGKVIDNVWQGDDAIALPPPCYIISCCLLLCRYFISYTPHYWFNSQCQWQVNNVSICILISYCINVPFI